MCSAELSITSGPVLTNYPMVCLNKLGLNPSIPYFLWIRSNTLRQGRIHGQLSFAILLQLLNMLPVYFIARSIFLGAQNNRLIERVLSRTHILNKQYLLHTLFIHRFLIEQQMDLTHVHQTVKNAQCPCARILVIYMS